MRAVRRFVDDESGMTLAFAMIMIVLIGAMGAGLLAFVNRDLFTVIQENRGQRAFELADAGVGAAKQQLYSDCSVDPTSCAPHYDGADGDDIQWSVSEGGLTLEDLDGDADTPDSVTVMIEPLGTDSFKAISTGTYGNAKRKVEAVFEPSGDGGGGGNIAYPATYASSDILISGGNVRINAMSFFTEGNIYFEGLTNQTAFENAYTNNNDLFNPQGNDELADWDTVATREPDEYWNTIGRDVKPNFLPASRFRGVGFGAEGMLCGTNATTGVPNCDEVTDSIADGAWGYDSTTGRFFPMALR